MKSVIRVFVIAVALHAVLDLSAASMPPADIVGRWIGSIETDRGDMQIALTLTPKDGALVGEIESPHGNWPVVSGVEKDGVWTITFKTESGEGRMKGRIANEKFAGEWDNAPNATGTFSLARSKKKGLS